LLEYEYNTHLTFSDKFYGYNSNMDKSKVNLYIILSRTGVGGSACLCVILSQQINEFMKITRDIVKSLCSTNGGINEI